MNADHKSLSVITQSSELNRWNLSEINIGPSAPPSYPSSRKMSLEFAPKSQHHNMYGQPDLDQPFNIPSSENVGKVVYSVTNRFRYS
jgi:hypothetical protein